MMLCKAELCFWSQQLRCNFLCPTTDLGKATSALCLVLASRHTSRAERSLVRLDPQCLEVGSVDGGLLATSN